METEQNDGFNGRTIKTLEPATPVISYILLTLSKRSLFKPIFFHNFSCVLPHKTQKHFNMKAVFVLFALVAAVVAEPGVLTAPVLAPAPAILAAPAVYHAPAVAIPTSVSSAYKIRAPAAKILATPVVAAHPAPVLLH